jgi:hypothetical protein
MYVFVSTMLSNISANLKRNSKIFLGFIREPMGNRLTKNPQLENLVILSLYLVASESTNLAKKNTANYESIHKALEK